MPICWSSSKRRLRLKRRSPKVALETPCGPHKSDVGLCGLTCARLSFAEQALPREKSGSCASLCSRCLSVRSREEWPLRMDSKSFSGSIQTYQLSNYSVKTTDCSDEISKRLRQRMFLHAIMSSFRTM